MMINMYIFEHGVSENSKTEMFMKIVPERGVNFSIGPFCTEFRCEQLCDDDIFQDRGQLWALR